MDINNIDLNAFTVAELYRSSLVLPAEKNVPETSVSPTGSFQPKWLGKNAKNVLVLVNHPDAIHMPDADLELLTSILTACKLSLEDVAILNLHPHPGFEYTQALTLFHPANMLLFGIEPSSIGLPLSFPYFQVQAFQQTSYLYSPALSSIGTDRNLKTSLWQSLKILFKL